MQKQVFSIHNYKSNKAVAPMLTQNQHYH